jgi:hypothetical protein
MAARGQPLTITFVAWDTSANAGKTGDVANHTLRWIKDGTSAAPANSPSEVDATNAKGVYKITLTAGECTCWVGTLAGKSDTANVSIIPLTVTFEQLTGYSLAATGLDAITATAPGGVASTFPQMVVQLWRRFFKKSTMTSSALVTYADDGSTAETTQTVSDDGTTQTQGAAS